MLPAVRGMGKHLVIAPPTDLEYAPGEVQRIVNALGATVLLDNVTIRTVLDTLRTPWESIWFIGHGAPEGVALEDGMLTASMLVQCLRQSPPALVVINTCESLRTAIRLHETLHCAVVCTLTKVPDDGAFVTNVRLAESIGAGADIAAAYEAARPDSNIEYVLLNGIARMNGVRPSDDTNRLILRLHMQVDELSEHVETVERRTRRTSPQLIAWAFGWLFLFAPVAVFLDLETLYDLTHSPALSWTALCWLVAALLFGFAFGLLGGQDV